MTWKDVVTVIVSVLGLVAIATGGMITLVWEMARDLEDQMTKTENRIETRIDRHEHRHFRLLDEILDNRERILKLENPKQEVNR